MFASKASREHHWQDNTEFSIGVDRLRELRIEKRQKGQVDRYFEWPRAPFSSTLAPIYFRVALRFVRSCTPTVWPQFLSQTLASDIWPIARTRENWREFAAGRFGREIFRT